MLVLGILPSQLRILTRNSIKEYEKALTDISKTLFWKGYAIWTKRKTLIADYCKILLVMNGKYTRAKSKYQKEKRKC